ncbi:MAG TPA: (d)CMP kinase [Bacteroidales bacterium]|nr:(d)CMP kinase [Rikenellaceae bacterium]HON54091.1 (d)CMP kinase [Bacteroidales bacterium]HRR48812.1 (d)CMP kinase [Bacteroidales bacterium]HRT33102.1 (d)CMP kinase [Bacteroidales bacterium]HRT83126.1 (d)CMP kinase [Bacteroidales bacterium]
MDSPKIIIAIDGHSSTGKSTFAKTIAKKFGLLYIDTGALYRGITLFAIQNGLITSDNKVKEAELKSLLPSVSMEFRVTGKDCESELYLNGKMVENEIRSLDVSSKVSYIAALPFVRNFVDEILRKYGKIRGVVMDGRDIGTVVFPDAEIKIFMTADAEVRAKRRYDEMIARGANADFNEILKNIIERDYIDEHRETDPLRKAPDALLLDNSHMTVDEQMEWLLSKISQKWN